MEFGVAAGRVTTYPGAIAPRMSTGGRTSAVCQHPMAPSAKPVGASEVAASGDLGRRVGFAVGGQP